MVTSSSWPVIENTAEDLSSGIYTRVSGDLKIHALHCGSVKVRRTHIESGLGPYFVWLDPRWTDWLPSYCFVIEHPEGIIVIDTGLSSTSHGILSSQAGVSGWFTNQMVQFRIQRHEEIDQRLAVLGIDPLKVRWVVLTHLQMDHTGGLRHFPNSEIIVSREEYIRPFGALELDFPTWFRPNLIGHFDKYESEFSSGYYLTEARDVVIVPTPGHTYGHQSVILKEFDRELFFAGDASYNYEQIWSAEVPGISIDRSFARDTLGKIQRFCLEHAACYLPSHDQNSVERFFFAHQPVRATG